MHVALSLLNNNRAHRERVFATLHYLVDVEFLRESYRRTRKDAAADKVTAQAYA